METVVASYTLPKRAEEEDDDEDDDAAAALDAYVPQYEAHT